MDFIMRKDRKISLEFIDEVCAYIIANKLDDPVWALTFI